MIYPFLLKCHDHISYLVHIFGLGLRLSELSYILLQFRLRLVT